MNHMLPETSRRRRSRYGRSLRNAATGTPQIFRNLVVGGSPELPAPE